MGHRDPGSGLYEYTWVTCAAPWCCKIRRVPRADLVMGRDVWECRYSKDDSSR